MRNEPLAAIGSHGSHGREAELSKLRKELSKVLENFNDVKDEDAKVLAITWRKLLAS